MISFFSSWVKNLCLALIVISLLEMILPNNKTKKYIKMVMGLYILFSILSPFIKNKDKIVNFNIDSYVNKTKETSNMKENANQNTMNERISEIYIQELEKDITKKIEEKGYIVEECNINAYISENEDDNGIKEIKLIIINKLNQNDNDNNQTLENRIVSEVQKIQKIKINTNENNKDINENTKEITTEDVQNIKKFLIDEYGVNEKCLKIN